MLHLGQIVLQVLISFLSLVYTIKSSTLDRSVNYHASTETVFFQSRGNSSSSANGHDMQSIRNMEGNEVCVDCGAPSKLGLLLLFFICVIHYMLRIVLKRWHQFFQKGKIEFVSLFFNTIEDWKNHFMSCHCDLNDVFPKANVLNT